MYDCQCLPSQYSIPISLDDYKIVCVILVHPFSMIIIASLPSRAPWYVYSHHESHSHESKNNAWNIAWHECISFCISNHVFVLIS